MRCLPCKLPLTAEKGAKTMLKAKKNKTEHSVFSNIMYFLRLMFKLSPGLVIGDILSGTLRLLPQRLISVIGIKYIIDVVVQGENLGRI